MVSCQNAVDKVNPHTATQQITTPTPARTPIRGQIINSVALANAPGQSYALFLPDSLGADSLRHVALFFDPHGNGDFPLRKYQELAEQYGFILMGSNNSKNGLSFQQTAEYAKNLVKEAYDKFQPTSISFCGFSGGAKVALIAGSRFPKVKTIIYCGAAVAIQPNHPLRLLGFAGTADMNYTDLVSFERSLNNPQIEHHLIEWDGPHEFPAPEVFEDAFAYIKTGSIKNLKSKGASISPPELANEQKIKQDYLEAFQNKDLNWWQNTTSALKQEDTKMNERLLGFISLACYSLTERAIDQNNIPMAERILAIYRMADPENEAIREYQDQLDRTR